MTPGQCRPSPALLLNWTQAELAKRPGISRHSLTRVESSHRTSDSLCQEIQRTLEKEGIRFVEDWGVTYREKLRRKAGGARSRS